MTKFWWVSPTIITILIFIKTVRNLDKPNSDILNIPQQKNKCRVILAFALSSLAWNIFLIMRLGLTCLHT